MTSRRVIVGPPEHRFSRWRFEVSQVSGSPSCRRAMIHNPPLAATTYPIASTLLLPSGFRGPWAKGRKANFEANSHGPLARVPTHLRQPHGAIARLTTGLPGLALTERGLHPLDD